MDAPQFSIKYIGKSTAQNEDEICAAFAELFKTTPQKAADILRQPRVLRKNLDARQAQLYQQKLSAIGLQVEVVDESTPPAFTLALEPLAGEPQAKSALEVVSSETKTATNAYGNASAKCALCPKCGAQLHHPEQCEACGIYVEKYRARQQQQAQALPSDAVAPAEALVHESEGPGEFVGETEDPFSEAWQLKALGAAALAALLGAFVWYGVALFTGYELGLLAWALGGAVGFAAATLGGRGLHTGVACGVLGFCAIFGGKYLTTAAFTQQFTEALQADTPEMREGMMAVYEEEKRIAAAYADTVDDEESLRQFMVDYEYSEEGEDAEEVSDDDLQYFDEYARPRLEWISNTQPDFDAWMHYGTDTLLGEMSTFSVMVEGLGIVDLLFLFLGVGTAFRLGSGMRR